MIKVLEFLEDKKVSEYFGSDETKRPKILARCFADTKEEVVKGAVIEGLPVGCILASGSKVIVADGSRGFLKSDGTWGWETSGGGGGTSELPEVNSDDNGKVLMVVGGAWGKSTDIVDNVTTQDLLNLYYVSVINQEGGDASVIALLTPDANGVIEPSGAILEENNDSAFFATAPVKAVNIVYDADPESWLPEAPIYFMPDSDFTNITCNGESIPIQGSNVTPGEKVLYAAVYTLGEQDNYVQVVRIGF